MRDELKRELDSRGSAEVINGKVVQVTQAINEADDSVEYLMFGELRRESVTPIAETCARCDGMNRFDGSAEKCQQHQATDARARGFHKLICPRQLSSYIWKD